MNIKRISTILILICLLGTLQGQVTIAVADFTNQSDAFYLDSWEKSVPEFLKSELSVSKQITLVERRALESVLQEQALSMTGLVDSTTAQQVGGLIGAQYIISGTINKTGSWIRIDAKIIKVQTGQVKSAKVRASDDKYQDEMIQLLADNIRFHLVGEGEYREKLEIKPYPTTYFLIATAGLGIGTVIINSVYQKKQDEYDSATQLSDNFDDKYDAANGLYKTRTVVASLAVTALAGTIYCWIRNLSPDEILASEYAANPVLIPGIAINNRGDWRAQLTVHF
jgi:TolB-like protein